MKTRKRARLMEHDWNEPEIPLGEEEERQLIIQLVSQLRCVECGRLYDLEDFALVHRLEAMWVLSTRCRHCEELCHVVVYMRPEVEPEPAIDLTPDEMIAAQGWQPISADDLLDVHTFLKEFDGNFEMLFSA
jgi:hypothetical protein